MTAAAVTTAIVGGSGAGRESKGPPSGSGGSSGTGRNTPQSGGVAAAAAPATATAGHPAERRSGGGGGSCVGSGKAKDVPQANRGSSSRPPGGHASSPKAASTPSGGSGAPRGVRRGGDPVAAPSRGPDGSGGVGPPQREERGAPPSPRPGRTPSIGAGGSGGGSAAGADGGAAESADLEQRGAPGGSPTDLEALNRLLQEASTCPPLSVSSLPSSPAAFVQMPHAAAERPLALHVCRVWGEAGLGDKEWGQALQMFETELNDQPRQAKAPSGAGGGGGGGEGRWTLETFSMWLLKRGRRLRECSQWFRAFDFDQDELVGLADFLQGLVASGAPRAPAPGTACGLCSALALFRLLDLEQRPKLEVRDLEQILEDARASPDLPLSMQQIAQRATDFDFFRQSLLPRLQGAPAFRLRIFDA